MELILKERKKTTPELFRGANICNLVAVFYMAKK